MSVRLVTYCYATQRNIINERSSSSSILFPILKNDSNKGDKLKLGILTNHYLFTYLLVYYLFI